MSRSLLLLCHRLQETPADTWVAWGWHHTPTPNCCFSQIDGDKLCKTQPTQLSCFLLSWKRRVNPCILLAPQVVQLHLSPVDISRAGQRRKCHIPVFTALGSNVKLPSSQSKQETGLGGGRSDGLQRWHCISIYNKQVVKDSFWNWPCSFQAGIPTGFLRWCVPLLIYCLSLRKYSL